VKIIELYEHPYQQFMPLAGKAIERGDLNKAREHLMNAFESLTEELEDKGIRNPKEHSFLEKESKRIERAFNSLLPSPPPVQVTSSAKIRRSGNTLEALIEPREPEYDFSKVGGMENLKEEIRDRIILPMLYPEDFRAVVGKDFNGVLLYGLTGCGKTYIANAIAGEVVKQTGQAVNYYKLHGGDFRKYGSSMVDEVVRSMFRTIADNEPAIVFIDEIEAVAPRRKDYGTANARITSATLDAFEEFKGKQVLIIAATNKPYNVDFALMGNHRLGKPIFVAPPDNKARSEIFKAHLYGKSTSGRIDTGYLAALTDGYSSADIAEIVNRAGRSAVKRKIAENLNTPTITIQDLEFAVEDTESSLLDCCSQMKSDMLNGNYPPEAR